MVVSTRVEPSEFVVVTTETKVDGSLDENSVAILGSVYSSKGILRCRRAWCNNLCYWLNGNGAQAVGYRNIDDFGCRPSRSWTRDQPSTNSVASRYTRRQFDCHHRLGKGSREQKPQRKGTIEVLHLAREIEDTWKWIQQYQELEAVAATQDQKSVTVANDVAIMAQRRE